MWVRVAGGKTRTSSRAPLAGIFGEHVASSDIFGQHTFASPATFGPTEPPVWKAGAIGPDFRRRPVPASRVAAYGPPFETRPGPLPFQDMGLQSRLHDYPNNAFAGTGRSAGLGGCGSCQKHGASGFGAITYSERTCESWCADPATAMHGATCANQALVCRQPRFFAPYWGEQALRCDERCVRRERPVDWSPSLNPVNLLVEYTNEWGLQYDALERAVRGAAITMAEWTGIVQKYREAKAEFNDAASKLPPLPIGHPMAVKLMGLREKEARIDRELAASATSGFGLADKVILAIAFTTGGVILAGWFAKIIKDFISEWLERKACITESQKVPVADRGAFLRDCRVQAGGLAWWQIALMVGGVGVLGFGLWKSGALGKAAGAVRSVA